jgi:Fe-Mn family superoxide dismutase
MNMLAPLSCQVPSLPYAYDALEPLISARTVETHYTKHHLGYASKLQGLIQDTDMRDMSLVQLVRHSAGLANPSIFRNAAQIWNHTFYWQSLRPSGAEHCFQNDFLSLINASFGSLDQLVAHMAQEGLAQFGSGWVWLVQKGCDEKGVPVLAIVKTGNADVPWLDAGVKPLCVYDVWEHAYYLDYASDRASYLKTMMSLMNWAFAEANFHKSFQEVVG